MSARYDFTAKLWRAQVTAAWYFVTAPVDLSKQIRTIAGAKLNAFGSLRVTSSIGETSWKSSLFFDTKANAFLLPIKAEVRRKAGVSVGDDVNVSVVIEL